MKLLIVDDSLSIRRKIQRCALSLSNLTIYSAGDGQEAIAVFEKELPDMVTMDLTMPNIGGVDCIEKLIEIKPDVHILVVSALADKATALLAIKNGAEGFLKKPFTDDEINIALSELLVSEGG